MFLIFFEKNINNYFENGLIIIFPMNQYKLGQLGKVWSMMSRHPEVLFKRYSRFRKFLEVFWPADTRFSIHPVRTRKFR